MAKSTSLRIVAGPDAGWATRLDPGKHWVGRSGVAVALVDPMIEPHHALLRVDHEGRMAILQTTGRSPVLVDRSPAHRWTDLPAGSGIEIGSSRIEVGAPEPPAATGVDRVDAPLDASDHEHARFARDVGLAADTAMARALVRPAGHVDLGVGEVELPIELRAASGEPIDPGNLDLTAQSILERASRRSVPIHAAITDDRPIAIVAADPARVVAAISAQLPERARARVIAVAAARAASFVGCGRPLLVVTDDRRRVPSWCRSVLDVGATWRATWCADVVDRPDRIVRLHARGAGPRRDQPVPAGRSSLSR